MKTLDLKQNSPEWEQFRRTHIGASDSPTICGANPYKTVYQLWKEKAIGETFSPNSAMIEGARLESHARELAEDFLGMQFSPLCILHPSVSYLMASLDGYNEDKGMSLEIKVVGDNVYEKVSERGPLSSWLYQMNHQMECTEKQESILFVLHRDKKDYKIFNINKEQSIVDEILEKDAKFYERLINFEPPEDTHMEREDIAWKIAAQNFMNAKEASAQAEEWLKMCRNDLINISNDNSCRGFGVTTTKYISKGTVDYAKIPELKSVDLSTYRKPSRESWRVA